MYTDKSFCSQRQFDAGVAESLTSSWGRDDHYISILLYWFLSLEYCTGTRHCKQWQHSGRNNYFILNILKRIEKLVIFLTLFISRRVFTHQQFIYSFKLLKKKFMVVWIFSNFFSVLRELLLNVCFWILYYAELISC